MSKNLFDTLLLETARTQVKHAFVGDPSGEGGGGDPSAGGGDPSGGGGGGAADVNAQLAAQAATQGGGLTEERVAQMIQAAVQGGGMGGGMGAGAGAAGAMGPNGMPMKKKVDVNTEIYQIKKLLIYMLQAQGVTVPPEMMLGDPADDPHADPNEASQDPASAGAAPGAQSAIKPISPMGAASPALAGAAGGGGGGGAMKQSQFLNRGEPISPSFLDTVNRASSLASLIRQANSL